MLETVVEEHWREYRAGTQLNVVNSKDTRNNDLDTIVKSKENAILVLKFKIYGMVEKNMF